MFAQQSAAVVGASPAPRKRGYRVLRNVAENGRAGRAFPHQPIGTEIPETPAFASIHAFPEPIDLAEFVIPSDARGCALMRRVTLMSPSYSELCLLDAAQGDGHGNPLRRFD
jgi:predicted CoA-binding protein